MMDMIWSDALALMQRALAMLDESHAPAQIGAHLDLAIIRLQEHISNAGAVAEELSRSIPRSMSD